MGKINLTINDELEREFREMAYKVKGMKKGFSDRRDRRSNKSVAKKCQVKRDQSLICSLFE